MAEPAVPAEKPRRRGRPLRVLLVVVGLLALPNLSILALHLWAARTAPQAGPSMPIRNFTPVDDRLWRGAAPGHDGLAALAREGVTTIVDLRAEDGIWVDEALLADLGLRRIHLPLRDGQSPGADQVARFLDAVQESPGRVYLHCGAGVGRTGTMAAAYLVETRQASPAEAMLRNLEMGPPSLEQLAFAAGLDDEIERPNAAIVAVSRALDAPRRAWVHLRGSYTKH